MWSHCCFFISKTILTHPARSCSCLGITSAISWFRQPQTASIADFDVRKEGGFVPLRTYGPYRSEYGRLSEFPNLPPLLVRTSYRAYRCTGTFEHILS